RSAGKANGWPDTFFRQSSLGGDLFGRRRWMAHTWAGSDYSAAALVPNPVFDGYALRKLVAGTAAHVGALVYMDEMGAGTGDTITIRALVTGSGGDARLGALPLTAAGSSNGSQVVGAPLIATTSATPQLVTIETVVAAN